MLTRTLIAAVVAAALLSTTVARAESANAGLTFAEAVGLGDQLLVWSAQRDAAKAERGLSLPRVWGPLGITLSPQRRSAPDEDRGTEGSLSIQQTFPLTGVGSARRAQLDAAADARDAATSAGVLAAKLEIAAAWIDGWAARERMVTATQDVELARAVLAATERGATAGVFTAPELADARAYTSEAELALRDASGRVAETGFELARVTARAGAIEVRGDLPEAPIPEEETWAALLERARRLPAVEAKRLEARAARARAVEERATRGTQLVVGAEVFRDGPGALVGGITLGVQLPHDRGQREALAAELEARVAVAESTTLATQAAAELARTLHEVEHTGDVLAAVRDKLVPAATDAAARRQRAFEVGESTIVEMLAAQRTAVAARARRADAEAAHAWARIRAFLLIEATR